MMDQMTGGMMWGMGLISLRVLALLILGVAALVKYLFFDARPRTAAGEYISAAGWG